MADILALPLLAATVVVFILYVAMAWLTRDGRALGDRFFEEDDGEDA
ncbi:MAG: hypothetical protein ACLGIM_06120 [Alphaproteobacteria bacterium]